MAGRALRPSRMRKSPVQMTKENAGIRVRTTLKPDDISDIVRYHYEYYAKNYGFNHDFGKYVQGPLTEFYERHSPDEGIWLLTNDAGLKGCIALSRVTDEQAQLRWFYVDESIRGHGFGNRLIKHLLDFAVERNYGEIILWTVDLLDDARRLYERHGFVLVEEKQSNSWGRELVEQRYLKKFRSLGG